MSWKAPFDQGVQHFYASRLDDAIKCFNKARVSRGGANSTVYDSRAAVYEKLGKMDDALRDSKKAIDLDPDSCKGYARCARLYFKLDRYDAAIKMSVLALSRFKSDDAKRRDELVSIKYQATVALHAHALCVARKAYNFGTLPFELSSEIFLSLAEEDPCYAVVLSHVCQHWRSIALGTPGLWKVLVLSQRNPRTKAQLWCRRSQSRIVELHLRKGLSDDMLPHRGTFYPKDLASISWETLRVLSSAIQPDDLCKLLQAANLQDLSELDTFEIIRDKEWGLHPWLPMLQKANIRSLKLCNVWSTWADMVGCFSELRILSLHLSSSLEDMEGTTLLHFLKANPRLETLSLELPPRQPLILPYIKVNLPGLLHLEFTGPSANFRRVVDKLSIARLETLTVSKVQEVDGWLHKLIRRHHVGHITELRVRSCSVSAAAIHRFLQNAPNLSTLELSRIGDNQINDVIEQLAKPIANSNGSYKLLCPLLAHVDFSHCPDVTSGSVVHLIKSRIAPIAGDRDYKYDDATGPQSRSQSQILSLVINGCPLVESSVIPWLRSEVRSVDCDYVSKTEAKSRPWR